MIARKRVRAEPLKDDTERNLVLDQDEVIQAMLGAQRYSRVGDSSDGEDGSDVESSRSSGGSVEDREVTRKLGLTNNTSAKRSRKKSDSEKSESDPTDIASPYPSMQADIGSTTSRVKTSNAAGPSMISTNIAPVLLDPPKASIPITFASLGLSQPLISALETINIRTPTEIQAACIGPILEGELAYPSDGIKKAYNPGKGRDCIGGAKTGSGKTMAFALPIAERIARDPYGVWAIVLTPTR